MAAARPPAATARLSLLSTAPLATELLAHFFAADLQPTDCYLLYGGVGAGKSYFSRSFIRAAAGDASLPVPSPTFLLQNVYDEHEGPPIHHYDLYRLTEAHDLARLDLQTSFTTAVSLIEWPERLAAHGGALPPGHLAITLSVLGAEEQQALAAQGAVHEPLSDSDDWEGGGGSDGAEEEEEGGDGSGDVRWRRIQLASDSLRWAGRLALLQSYLEAEGPVFGCWVEQHLAEHR